MLSESRAQVLHYTQLGGELVYNVFRVSFSHRTSYIYEVSKHFQLRPWAHALTKGAGSRSVRCMQDANETSWLFPANVPPAGHVIPMSGQRQNHMGN